MTVVFNLVQWKVENISIPLDKMATDNLIAKLYASPKTILTIKDIALIWGETDRLRLLAKIKYYAKQGSLIRLSRGLFAKNKQYNPKELAGNIYTPSYISFETVLREAGIIFQHHEAIFVAGPYSITKKIDSNRIVFRKLKDKILFNSFGVNNRDGYSVAIPERAFLDTIYLSPRFYFDNLSSIDWGLCFELVKIYENKQLLKRLKNYAK